MDSGAIFNIQATSSLLHLTKLMFSNLILEIFRNKCHCNGKCFCVFGVFGVFGVFCVFFLSQIKSADQIGEKGGQVRGSLSCEDLP